MAQYVEYFPNISPRLIISKTVGGPMRVVSWGREFRDAAHVAIVPGRVGNESKPMRVRLIQCDTGLLLGMCIIKKLGLSINLTLRRVNSKSDRANGNRRLRTVKNHWVFPLPPTSSAYAKGWGFFREIDSRPIDVLTVKEDPGVDFEAKR